MPFIYDEENNSITMATGDTANLQISVEWDKLSAGDALLFAVFDRKIGDVLCKAVELVDGWASIRLCNSDTRDIPPGNYKWNIRIVTSPVLDDYGNVRVDECSDDVITVFNSPPKFKLTRGGAYV